MTRYVFWRSPNSKPSREQNDKHALTHILAAIGNPANTAGVGIQWPGSATQRFQVALKSAIIVLDPDDGGELNGTDAWGIIWSALTSVLKREGGGKPIQSSHLIREADKKAAEFFRKPENEYIMVTSLSVKDFPMRRIRVRGATISRLSKRGKRFPYPRLHGIHRSLGW